jgi:glycerate 2-kinase
MSKRILIAPNSFKECADSVTIAELIRDNLADISDAELIVKPISDGGDGFLTVCKFYFGGVIRNYSILKAYEDVAFECPVLYCEKRKELYIESAEVLGFNAVPMFYRNPLKLSSKGLGQLLKQIETDVRDSKINVKKVYLGVGGTATIDMGMGMMSELGLKLFDSDGGALAVLPENYKLVQNFEFKPVQFSFELMTVVDVTNPIFGTQGGVRVFGTQKQADEKKILQLEEGFYHLLKLFENKGLQFSLNTLSGAGGGIPAAIQIFLNTEMLSSSEFIEYHLGMHKFSDLDLVDYLITGEGAYDHQSGFGKGIGVLIHMFRSGVKQIFLVCGKISSDSAGKLPKYVYPIEIAKYFDYEHESIIKYKEGIQKACSEIIKQINI